MTSLTMYANNYVLHLLLLHICVWWIHEALKISNKIYIIICDELSATSCPATSCPATNCSQRIVRDKLSATNCPATNRPVTAFVLLTVFHLILGKISHICQFI